MPSSLSRHQYLQLSILNARVDNMQQQRRYHLYLIATATQPTGLELYLMIKDRKRGI